ncbi:MAG: TonB-dependent receptor plug domain-containing protein [Christiangramia sp.]|nr:TonB-dependent receptor plug domain-containing protein [Christiangramia sp.]
MKKFLCSILLLFGGFFSMQAQTFTVEGNVTDENGMPLLGVNVLVKGESRGTTTDFDGNFSISEVSEENVLVVSYVGFQTMEVPVTGDSFLNIVLNTDAGALEEVVVIGYGTQQRKDITGAVSVVSGETIEEMKPIRLEQALQGTAAGVNVTPSSGAPGAGININIRGVASNSVNGPLVLIDGYQGDLGTLNPNDVESISILKDAQAAIYGIAGANGVVLITTKGGKKEMAPTVQYDSYVGMQETSRKLPLLNATEYALLLNESYANNGQALPYPNVSGLGEGTDFQDEVFDTAPIINHNVTLSGGSEKVTYSVGASHLNQEGIIGADKDIGQGIYGNNPEAQVEQSPYRIKAKYFFKQILPLFKTPYAKYKGQTGKKKRIQIDKIPSDLAGIMHIGNPDVCKIKYGYKDEMI